MAFSTIYSTQDKSVEVMTNGSDEIWVALANSTFRVPGLPALQYLRQVAVGNPGNLTSPITHDLCFHAQVDDGTLAIQVGGYDITATITTKNIAQLVAGLDAAIRWAKEGRDLWSSVGHV